MRKQKKAKTPRLQVFDDYRTVYDNVLVLQCSMREFDEYLRDKIWIGADDEKIEVKENLEKIKEILALMDSIKLR